MIRSALYTGFKWLIILVALVGGGAEMALKTETTRGWEAALYAALVILSAVLALVVVGCIGEGMLAWEEIHGKPIKDD